MKHVKPEYRPMDVFELVKKRDMMLARLCFNNFRKRIQHSDGSVTYTFEPVDAKRLAKFLRLK